jgi:phosphonate transport system permease protein
MTRLSLEQARMRHISRPSPLSARTLVTLLAVGAVGWSLVQAGIGSREVVNTGGWPLAWRFLRASVQPDLSPNLLWLAAHSTFVTLAYAVCGTVLSLIIGVIGGLLGSEAWWQIVRPQGQTAPWLAARSVLVLPRAIHEVIWGLFFINILGTDPLVAILAIGIPFGAITAKVFAEIIDETPRTAFTALRHCGVAPLPAFLYSIVPQALPDLLAYAFYRFECAIRAATMLGLIGAGGLGYQVLLSLQSLRYEQMWTFLFALLLLSGLSDAWSSLLRCRLTGATADCNTVELHSGSQIQSRPWHKGFDRIVRFSVLAVLLLVPWSFWYVSADVGRLVSPRTMQLFIGVVHDSVPPRLDPPLLAELWQLAGQTLAMSVLAMVFAGLGGIVLSFGAARTFAVPHGLLSSSGTMWRRVSGWFMLVLTRGVLLLTRAIAEPIWALLLLFVLFPGILPGALALGLYNLGILGRLMAEVNENMDARPLRALQAQGATATHVFLYGVLPLTLPRYLAYILYRWEVCIRATVVVGLVGAGGLGRLLTEQLVSFDYRSVVTTLAAFVALTLLVDLLSAMLRRMVR